jgi:hypothetical protein
VHFFLYVSRFPWIMSLCNLPLYMPNSEIDNGKALDKCSTWQTLDILLAVFLARRAISMIGKKKKLDRFLGCRDQ